MSAGRLAANRRVLVAIAAVVAVVALSACDWSMYRSDAAHSGTVAETVIGKGNVATLHEAWTTGATGGFENVNGLVAVAGGRLYTQTADGLLSAYDTNAVANCSGTPKRCLPVWKAPQRFADAAVANGVVYV